MPEPAIVALKDPEALAQHVALWLTGLARAATGRFAIALSGGSTPKRLFEILAEPAQGKPVPLGANASVLGRRTLSCRPITRTATSA